VNRIIITGGGTGGHVYPAIAIADAVMKRAPQTEILFIGATGRLEMDQVPAAGYRIEGLPITGFIRRLTLKNLLFPFRLASSLLKARRLVRNFHPDAVIGVGGYASGPAVKVAAGMGIPTLILEQNSYPGVTNKILSANVLRICVAFEGMERYFPKDKIVFTGNPVRKDFCDLESKKEKAVQYFRLNPGLTTLLVLGGSGGAATINQGIHSFITAGIPPALQIIWQTGRHYYSQVVASTGMSEDNSVTDIPTDDLRSKCRIFPFINRMDLAYAVADMVLSRAGAVSIAELCATGKAAILVPSPNVADDHQTKNAQALVDKNAVMLLRDADVTDTLRTMLIELLNNKELRENLKRNIQSLAIPEASERITDEIFSLIQTYS
jgi:UDP-N-acetylglucosamine--N-acetylmuramyl-(pentapeptide) pyrophosphoryl-undecaprenol N-acetylglucosamine transferase